MKKFLLILPLSFALGYSSAQDTKDMQEKSDMKNSEIRETKDSKIKSIRTLDGKSYKITLMTRKTGDIKNTGTSDNNMTQPVQPATAPVDKTTSPPTAPGNQPPVVTDNPATMPSNPDHTAVKHDDAIVPPATPEQAQTGIERNPATPGTIKEGDTGEDFASKKIIIRFQDGMIQSTALSSKGVETCPYNVNSADANILSFSSNCKSSVTRVRGMWSGIVDGNNIRGNFTYTTDDGRNLYYTFSGTAATQKEIDASQELGVR